MKKAISNLPTLCFLLVLVIVANPSESTVIDIPTSTGTRGECYDTLREDHQDNMDRIDRIEEAEIASINIDRRDALSILRDYDESPPRLQTSLNVLREWLWSLLRRITLAAAERIVGVHYDNEIVKVEGIRNLSRHNERGNARARARGCAKLPTTSSGTGQSGGALESDPSQIHNTNFNWSIWGGLTTCGDYSLSQSYGKKVTKC